MCKKNPAIYVIEDETHSEWCGEFQTFDQAFAELKRRAAIPWGVAPNVCPCTSWKTCQRIYEIVEYDTSVKPWKEKDRTFIFSVSSRGIEWNEEYKT